MPPPKIFDCGGTNQPPCPPEPAVSTSVSTANESDDVPRYTYNDMAAHGQNCWLAAKAWDREKVTAILDGDVDRQKSVIAKLGAELKEKE